MAEAERPTTAAPQAAVTPSVRPARPARLTSLPNMLGVARIAATPVVIALLLYPFPGAGLLACVVFWAAATDRLVDGRLARARGEVSPLGIFMDLTADKVLVAGALIAMVEVSLLSTWIAALLLIRELVVQGVRQLAASADVVMAARAWGKGKTFATLLGMGLLCSPMTPPPAVRMARIVTGDWLTILGVATMLLATVLERGLRAGLHPRGPAAAAGTGAGSAYLISLRSIWRMAMNMQIPQKTTRYRTSHASRGSISPVVSARTSTTPWYSGIASIRIWTGTG